MICFRVKTDQEVKEKGHVGPTLKKYNKKNKIKLKDRHERGAEREIFFNLYFLHFSLSSIYENRTVRIRRGKNENALLDEGYAWEPKTRDFVEFSIKKICKILCFGFFSNLRLSEGQNW